jgi:hypothetical protein
MPKLESHQLVSATIVIHGISAISKALFRMPNDDYRQIQASIRLLCSWI